MFSKGHPDYYLDIAKKIAIKKNAFYINQFDNKANLASHYNMLGPEIYNQLKGKVDAFVAGVGTGGTITGVGKYLKKKNKKFELVLADPKGSILKQLVDTGKLSNEVGSWIVEGIGEDFCPPLFDKRLIDHAFTITDKEALKTCNKILQKEGILAGSSSGTLIAAAIKYCKAQKVKKNVVTLVCDAGDKYLRKVYNESWKIKAGLNDKKSKKDITDIISYPESTGTMPKINKDSSCKLAFKLMNENSLDKLLVEDNNKNILGIIDEDNLFKAVTSNSFEEKINNYITKKIKKFSITLKLKTLLVALKKKSVYLSTKKINLLA